MRPKLAVLLLIPIVAIVWLAERRGGVSEVEPTATAEIDGPGRRDLVGVGASASRVAMGAEEVVVVDPGSAAGPETRSVSRFHGQVVDARTSAPVPSLTFHVDDDDGETLARVTTDVEGRFDVESLVHGQWSLWPMEGDYYDAIPVTHAGDEEQRLEVEVGPTYRVQLDPLPPGYEAGRFMAVASDAVDHPYALRAGGRDGEPLRPGPPMWVRFSPSQLNGDLDGGSWFLDVVSDDGYWHGVTEVPRAVGVTPDLLTVSMGARGTIAGRVTDEGGEPIRFFQVALANPDARLEPVFGDRGAFEAKGLAAGSWEVEVLVPDLLPERRTVVVEAGARKEIDLVVRRPEPVGPIVGRVVSRTGTFDERGRISLWGLDGAIGNRLLRSSWEESDGRRVFEFRFDDVPEGRFRVQWFSDGMPFRVEPSEIDVEAPARGLEFVVHDDVPTADLWFEAVDGGTGDPIEPFGAWWYSVGRKAQWSREATAGEPVARGWPFDNETVWIVHAEGYQPVRGDLADLALEDERRVGRVRLEPGWGIQFFVRETGTHEPLAEIVLTLDGQELEPTGEQGEVFATRAERPERVGVATPGWRLVGGNLDPATGFFTDDIPWATGVTLERTGH